MGLIPARAGTTNYVDITDWNAGAHPRSRGDHGLIGIMGLVLLGSSPLARGPRARRGSSWPPAGLIPARAGTTGSKGSSQRPGGAHPRSRGDHSTDHHQRRNPMGSSPLARGPQPLLQYRHQYRGLIPARAGTTRRCTIARLSVRAHPRSRGDHVDLKPPPPGPVGSSPLARGPHLLTWGFTPYISKIESL